MTTVFIARRDAQRARLAQARLEASRELRVVGVAQSLFRARAALPGLDPDALLLDLRLEDGAALSLVRELRQRGTDRPRLMLLATDPADPLLMSTLVAGADGYLLEADLPVAAAALTRLMAGEAAMAAPVAVQVLRFFNEVADAGLRAPALDERRLDWHSNGANPMRLSPGELRLVRQLAKGVRVGELALRMAQSVEALGRRIGNIYRKLSWDVRSGQLALLAA